MSDYLTYHDSWGEEQISEEKPQRELHSDAEVLGRICRMMDDDPLAFFVWTQRVLYRERTYEQIANRLEELNPRKVTRQAIYDRIKKMLARENDIMPARLVMPRAKQREKIKAVGGTFQKMINKYQQEKANGQDNG